MRASSGECSEFWRFPSLAESVLAEKRGAEDRVKRCIILQAQPNGQWRRPALLRLPGRSLVRIPLPGSSPGAAQQKSDSRGLSAGSELGSSNLQTQLMPSDASADLLNWEKQLGSWEEDSPRSAADISADRAAELEAHAHQLAAEVSSTGSEWEPLTASMDDSGEGTDLVAGLGPDTTDSAADNDIPSQAAQQASAVNSSPSRSADAEAKSLAPMWPLSLYPLSYRQDGITENIQRADMGAPAASASENRAPKLVSASSKSVATEQLRAPASELIGSAGSAREFRVGAGNDMPQSWLEESQLSSMSDDCSDDEVASQSASLSAETPPLWRSRRSQVPDAAEKVSHAGHAQHICIGMLHEGLA